MRIGEAQQIYPEIWQHLDTARETLAKRGVDVGAFDRIREVEGQALGANVGLETHSYGYGSRGVDQQVKTAGFNAQGVGRARQACKALMDATPEIDWKAIAAAESADPAAADFARSTRNKRYARFAALALLIFAPFGIVMYMRHRERVKLREYQAQYEPPVAPAPPPLTEGEIARWEKLYAEVKAQLTAGLASWPTVTDRKALDALVPTGAPCTFPYQPPTTAEFERLVRSGYWRIDLDNFYPSHRDRGPIPDAPLRNVLRAMKDIAAKFANRAVWDYDRRYSPPRHFVLLDVMRETKPQRTRDSYEPGEIVADVYVYSLAEQKIVCKGHIEARNASPETSPYRDLTLSPEGERVLKNELSGRIHQAIATNLRAL